MIVSPRSHCSERLLDDFDVRSGDGDDVEAHCSPTVRVLDQPTCGEEPDSPLLVRPDGRGSRPETIIGTGLDLGEDDQPRTGDDDVQLPDVDPPVPIDELVAIAEVPTHGFVLTPAPSGAIAQVPVIHATHLPVGDDRLDTTSDTGKRRGE